MIEAMSKKCMKHTEKLLFLKLDQLDFKEHFARAIE